MTPCRFDTAPPERSDWSVPDHDHVAFAERRSRYAVCLFVINEAERLHRQLAKMRAVDHGLDVVIADGGSTAGARRRRNGTSSGR